MLRSVTAKTRRLLIVILSGFLVALVVFYATRTPPITDPAAMKARVLNVVPLGSMIAHAEQAMEQQGFECIHKTNSDFGAYRQIDYVYCDRTDSAGFPIVRRWQIALVYADKHILDVLVSTGLIGP